MANFFLYNLRNPQLSFRCTAVICCTLTEDIAAFSGQWGQWNTVLNQKKHFMNLGSLEILLTVPLILQHINVCIL